MAANFFGPFTEIAPHTVTVSLPTISLFSALSWKFLPTLCRCPLAKYLLSPLTLGEKAKVKI